MIDGVVKSPISGAAGFKQSLVPRGHSKSSLISFGAYIGLLEVYAFRKSCAYLHSHLGASIDLFTSLSWLRFNQNRGKGAALLQGAKKAAELGYDTIITCGAARSYRDMTHGLAMEKMTIPRQTPRQCQKGRRCSQVSIK